MAGCAATAAHLRPVGNAAPPRPTSFDAVTSSITPAGPIGSALRSARSRRTPGTRRGTSGRRDPPGRAGGARGRRPGAQLAGIADVGGERGRQADGREHAGDVVGPADAAPDVGLGRRAGRGHEHRRRPLALPEARAAQPGRVLVAGRRARRSEPRLELIADPLRAQQPAREVVADVGDDRRARRRRQQRVERRDAVRLRGRDGEPLADVVQGAAADPADARGHGLERRQQQVAPCPRVVAAVREVAVGRDVRSPPFQPDRGGPISGSSAASIAARSSGVAEGPTTWRSIGPSVRRSRW